MFFMLTGDLRDAAERRSDRGATAVEYGLLVAFIALIVVGGVTLFGQALSGFFSDLATAIGGW
ncbi:Flp family type IVb pilin [Nocardioides sp. GY 10127]|nr:Flp family type IVb pilin [Nocardioides sp. GY 10127]